MLGAKDFRGWTLTLGVAACGLVCWLSWQADRPLLINLGPGDEAYARGFRPGWERDGRTGSGETTFHWTLDGSRLEFPVERLAGEATLYLRLARFSDTPAEVTLFQGGRKLEGWTQPPRGWSVRSFELGPVPGPLSFQFRSESADDLGLALDWAEVRGAKRLRTSAAHLGRLGLVMVGLPLLLLSVLGARGAAGAAIVLLLGLAAGLYADRLGALEAVVRGAPAALLVAATLVTLVRLLRRTWPESFLGPAAAAPALLAALAAVLLLSHPSYFYPDVATHSRFLAAVREDPYLLWDASEYQQRTGTWAMREIAGHRLAFPYSAVFHALAWPCALLLGNEAAVKAVAATALGFSVLLVHVWGRAAGLSAAGAAVGQTLVALWPATWSRLSLALFPTLLGQAMDLLLVVHLARRYPQLEGARDAAWAWAFLLLAQAAYTGSILNVGLVVGMFGLAELVSGDRPRARRLLAAYGVALFAVVALQYARFLPLFVPLLFGSLLPGALHEAGAGAAPALGAALDRFRLFYDGVAPVLALLGAFFVARAPRHVARLLFVVMGAGGLMLVGRYLLPDLFRDAKEIELMAPTLAVLTGAGLELLARRRGPPRLLATLAALALLWFCIVTSATLYAARFVAIGRP